MTFPELLHYTHLRLKKRWVWVGVLALSIPASLSRLFFEVTHMALGPWTLLYALVLPFCLFGSLAWLAPLAWLWTGKPGDRPRIWRGILQGLLFGALSMGFLISLEMGVIHTFEGPLLDLWRKAAEGIVSVSVVFCLVGFVAVTLDQTSLAKEEAERREREAQWILLKGQINPHVFFNAMSNLTELIVKDPHAAECAAMDLTELLRRLMDHGHRHLALFSEERSLVERYLAVEGLRLGTRLRVSWAWDPALDLVEAPPFLLQPMVENAIKHGIAPAPDGGALSIVGEMKSGMARISVLNEGVPFTGRRSGGLGLANLESRLALAFGEDARFSLDAEGAGTMARVEFPTPREFP